MRPQSYDMYFIILQFIIVCFALPVWASSNETWREAQASYQQGEKATTYEEQQLAFNQALFLYHHVEKEIPYDANVKQALADTYFRLGEYPWAILYYQRALKENENHAVLLSRLEKAQKALGLPFSPPQQNWMQLFLKFSQQTQLFFGVILITFLSFSFAIWFSFSWVRQFAIFCLFLLSLLFINALVVYYFTPLEGIIVKTTPLYRAPQEDQPLITNEPLLAGSNIQVLNITLDQNWLKVKSSSGLIGYIPITHFRSI